MNDATDFCSVLAASLLSLAHPPLIKVNVVPPVLPCLPLAAPPLVCLGSFHGDVLKHVLQRFSPVLLHSSHKRYQTVLCRIPPRLPLPVTSHLVL